MKSAAWAQKINGVAAGEIPAVFQEYAEETRQLIAERTKGSGVFGEKENEKVDTRPSVIDGVLREQRQKWMAICRQTRSLTTQMFDNDIVGFFMPEVVASQKKWQEALLKAKGKPKASEEQGRRLIQNEAHASF